MDFSKLSDQDLIALKNGKYESLSDEGLKELKSQTTQHLTTQQPTMQQQSVQGNWEGISPRPLVVPEEASAQGLGALGDLAAGKGLDQASQVAQGQAQPSSLPGKIGNVAGQMVSPTNLVAGAVMAPSVQAASSAAGNVVKNVASTLAAPGESESRVLADNLMTQNAPQAVAKAKQLSQMGLQKATDTIAQLKQTLMQVPQEFAQKTEMLNSLNMAAKKTMQTVEEQTPGLEFKGGSGFNSYVQNSQKMSELAEIMAKWKGQVPENMPLQQQQLFRKLAQEGSNSVDNISRAVLQQGRESLAQSIAKQVPQFDAARQQFLQVQNAIESLPADKLAKTTALKAGLLKAQTELQSLKSESQQLIEAAKNADADQLLDLKKKANDLIQRGIQHDSYVRNLWKTAGAAGLAAIGAKKIQGVME